MSNPPVHPYYSIRRACVRAAEHPARGLHTLPILANAALVCATLLGCLLLGMHFDDPLSWLAAVVYGPAGPCIPGALAFGLSLRLVHSRLLVRHCALEQQSLDFAERFAAALDPPPPPALLVHPERFHSAHLIYSACRRAAMRESLRLRRGLPALATIAVSAPLFGFLGSVLGIVNSFPGSSGPPGHALGLAAERLSNAIVPTAWALGITCIGCLLHSFLASKHEAIEQEMGTLSLSLANALQLRDR